MHQGWWDELSYGTSECRARVGKTHAGDWLAQKSNPISTDINTVFSARLTDPWTWREKGPDDAQWIRQQRIHCRNSSGWNELFKQIFACPLERCASNAATARFLWAMTTWPMQPQTEGSTLSIFHESMVAEWQGLRAVWQTTSRFSGWFPWNPQVILG